MDPAVFVHNTFLGIDVHARRPHMMISAAQAGRRGVILHLDMQSSQSCMANLFVNYLLRSNGATYVYRAQLPVQMHAVLAETVALGSEHHPAIRIRYLLSHVGQNEPLYLLFEDSASFLFELAAKNANPI